jgi:hypothetical protein
VTNSATKPRHKKEEDDITMDIKTRTMTDASDDFSEVLQTWLAHKTLKATSEVH